MISAFKASKIITITSGVFSALFLGLMIFIIFKNKDLLKKEPQGEGEDGNDYYNKIKVNPNIDEESDIGVSLVRNAINRQSALTQDNAGKLSSKSLVI